ncbi:MAG: hypothetical protein WEB90_02860 [Gemmatimonadota bacterium]
MTPTGAAVLYFDTVTLSNFALASRTDLLTERYGTRACVTAEVLGEVTEGVAVGYPPLRAIIDAVEKGAFAASGGLTAEEREVFATLLRVLSPGEASCIACAKLRSGIVVTDDRTARSCCREHDVAFTGTIGNLKACCVDGTLSPDEADATLGTMIEAGFFSPVARISDLL